MSLGAWGDERWDIDPNGPVAITEMLLRMPKPITRGMVMNMPAGGMSFHGRLFQARMWREYAMAIRYDRATRTGVGRRWCLEIGKWTFAECVRRARVNLYLAHRINRRALIAEYSITKRTTEG
jgi:hypothetical protein